jgi:hypothetical protein
LKTHRDDGACPKKQNNDRLEKLEKGRPVADRDFRKMRVVIDEKGNRALSEARRQIIGDRDRRHIMRGLIRMIAAIGGEPARVILKTKRQRDEKDSKKNTPCFVCKVVVGRRGW